MQYQTPGVYVEEIASIGSQSVPNVPFRGTFIGYTERATGSKGEDLHLKPTLVRSFMEYQEWFGGPDLVAKWSVTLNASNQVQGMEVTGGTRFFMYNAVRLYFLNGGGPAYIVSVGKTADAQGNRSSIELENAQAGTGLKPGLESLATLEDGLLLAIPESVFLDFSEYQTLMDLALGFAAEKHAHFVLLDSLQGTSSDATAASTVIRNHTGTENLSFGAAYHPWVLTAGSFHPPVSSLEIVGGAPLSSLANGDAALLALTTVWEDAQSNLNSFTGNTLYGTHLVDLHAGLESYQTAVTSATSTANWNRSVKVLNYFVAMANQLVALQALSGPLKQQADQMEQSTTMQSLVQTIAGLVEESSSNASISASPTSLNTAFDGSDWLGGQNRSGFAVATPFAGSSPQDYATFITTELGPSQIQQLFNAIDILWHSAQNMEKAASEGLYQDHPAFGQIAMRSAEIALGLPASAAVAGQYIRTQNEAGVWKAPAGMALTGVARPMARISDTGQAGMNIDASSGKSINAIRSFSGKGTLIWGGRTLDGNSNDWRYVNVRRLFSQVESDLKVALGSFVFEPNDANTWANVRAMVSNYLTELWKEGGLTGSKPEEAFFVQIGLGSSMSENDVLNGRMIIQIGMAAVRPAEFIILKMSQTMIA